MLHIFRNLLYLVNMACITMDLNLFTPTLIHVLYFVAAVERRWPQTHTHTSLNSLLLKLTLCMVENRLVSELVPQRPRSIISSIPEEPHWLNSSLCNTDFMSCLSRSLFPFSSFDLCADWSKGKDSSLCLVSDSFCRALHQLLCAAHLFSDVISSSYSPPLYTHKFRNGSHLPTMQLSPQNN